MFTIYKLLLSCCKIEGLEEHAEEELIFKACKAQTVAGHLYHNINGIVNSL